ncbi:MAG: LysR substrate-binding domain-containing protein [Gammaproteobacteria bacterium]|nr:LysR substrate-binding domain-containing protein [Gammaproteobacteria bacterium]
MTLTELRYVVALARHRHFGRAAKACFVSQPTLSVGIRKIEQELGVVLFERNAADVTVTPQGQAIVDQALKVLEEADTLKRMAEGAQDPLAGPLRLGAIYTIGPYLFPDLIPELKKAAPEMPLILSEGFTADLAQKLRHGEIDAAILALPFERPGLLTLPLYDEPFVVLLPSGHPLGEREKIQSRWLRDENLLLLSDGHCFRDQVIETCPECLDAESATTEGSSLETIRHMVASGLGVTVLPCTAAGADRFTRRMLTVRRFANRDAKRTVAVAFRASFPRFPAIEALRKAVWRCKLSCVTMRES